MSKKLVAVATATGKQGSSVVNALLKHGGYAVRGLTRDPSSAASQALAAQGVEMVKATPIDKPSLLEAFKGAYAVFGVTIPFTADSETEQGKNMVDACLANHVPLFVWSSLPDSLEMSGGKEKLPFFDLKADVEKYIKAVGQPSVIWHTGSFSENMFTQHQLQQVSSEKWEIRPALAPADLNQPFSYIEKDMGAATVAVIDHWDDPEWRERLSEAPIPMVSYKITGTKMAEIVAKATGKEVAYVPTDAVPPPVKVMWEFAKKYWGYMDKDCPPAILIDLGVKFHTFDDFVQERVVPYIKEKGQA